MEALVAQLAEERLEGPGVVGEAVQAQRQRPVRRPRFEVGEVDPVGGHAPLLHRYRAYGPAAFSGRSGTLGTLGTCPRPRTAVPTLREKKRSSAPRGSPRSSPEA